MDERSLVKKTIDIRPLKISYRDDMVHNIPRVITRCPVGIFPPPPDQILIVDGLCCTFLRLLAHLLTRVQSDALHTGVTNEFLVKKMFQDLYFLLNLTRASVISRMLEYGSVSSS